MKKVWFGIFICDVNMGGDGMLGTHKGTAEVSAMLESCIIKVNPLWHCFHGNVISNQAIGSPY